MNNLPPEHKLYFDKAEKILNYTFKNREYLQLALTHRSYTNQLKKQGDIYNNERIEFLGDAVLELVISDYLYRNYPDFSEGILTLVRSTIVRTTSLSKAVEEISLGECIIMGKGEEKTGGRTKPYILANIFESIVGALFLDGGIEVASDFIFRTLKAHADHVIEHKQYVDPKTQLQEITQNHFKKTPNYTIIHESGPAHEKNYVAAVLVDKKKLAEGTGSSKQRAEEDAAEKALEIIDNLIKSSDAEN
jgi:ribonuclease-3